MFPDCFWRGTRILCFMGQILFFAPVSLIFAQSESHVLRFALSENFSGRVCFLFRTTNFNLLVRPSLGECPAEGAPSGRTNPEQPELLIFSMKI